MAYYGWTGTVDLSVVYQEELIAQVELRDAVLYAFDFALAQGEG